MSHSDDDIFLFVFFVDIPVSLGNLFQRIASINDRFYLSRFNKLILSRLYLFGRPGTDCRWIESFYDQPYCKNHFLQGYWKK